jgi:hypothetical protein
MGTNDYRIVILNHENDNKIDIEENIPPCLITEGYISKLLNGEYEIVIEENSFEYDYHNFGGPICVYADCYVVHYVVETVDGERLDEGEMVFPIDKVLNNDQIEDYCTQAGRAIVHIAFDENGTQPVPGETYHLTVTMAEETE